MEDQRGTIKTLFYHKPLGRYLCFKHAVMRACRAENVELIIDEFGDEHDMRNTLCPDCYDDWDLSFTQAPPQDPNICCEGFIYHCEICEHFGNCLETLEICENCAHVHEGNCHMCAGENYGCTTEVHPRGTCTNWKHYAL